MLLPLLMSSLYLGRPHVGLGLIIHQKQSLSDRLKNNFLKPGLGSFPMCPLGVQCWISETPNQQSLKGRPVMIISLR